MSHCAGLAGVGQLAPVEPALAHGALGRHAPLPEHAPRLLVGQLELDEELQRGDEVGVEPVHEDVERALARDQQHHDPGEPW